MGYMLEDDSCLVYYLKGNGHLRRQKMVIGQLERLIAILAMKDLYPRNQREPHFNLKDSI